VRSWQDNIALMLRKINGAAYLFHPFLNSLLNFFSRFVRLFSASTPAFTLSDKLRTLDR
jgi:hypothetical protein